MAEPITADPVFTPEEKQPAESLLRAERPGVTRYKRPVVIAIAAGLAFIFAFGLIFAFALGGRRQDTAVKEDQTPIQLANPDLTKLPSSYSDPKAQRPDLGAPGTAGLPPPGTDPNAQAGQPGQTPQQAGNYRQQRPQLTPAQQRAEAARNAAIQQEMAARAGAIMVADNQGSQRAGAGAGGQYDAQGNGAAGPNQPQQQGEQEDRDTPGRQNLQSHKEQFIQSARIDQDYLKSGIADPVSPYEVKAGTIIPAALVTALNSDLPGEVIATVTENVYDHVTGRAVLIPQGTRLFGKYDSRVAYRQRRALVVWNRIIFPNGTSINIGGMIGTDATGAAGLADKVNNHYGTLLGGVFLSTAIAFGGAAADRAGTQRDQLVTAGGGAIAQESSRTGQQFVTRALDTQPTITIRPGFRLKIIVDKDMVLRPY